MLRIRRKNGELIQIPESGFVEVCDGEGLLIYVTYISEDGELVSIKPNTPEAMHYSKLFKTKFRKSITTIKTN